MQIIYSSFHISVPVATTLTRYKWRMYCHIYSQATSEFMSYYFAFRMDLFLSGKNSTKYRELLLRLLSILTHPDFLISKYSQGVVLCFCTYIVNYKYKHFWRCIQLGTLSWARLVQCFFFYILLKSPLKDRNPPPKSIRYKTGRGRCISCIHHFWCYIILIWMKFAGLEDVRMIQHNITRHKS